MEKIIQYIRSQHDRYLKELTEFLRIPSISSDPNYSEAMWKTAEFTRDQLLEAGCAMAEITETTGHPVVTGSIITDPKLPTILIYGHYDVQPVDPIELWEKDPFEAHIKNDTIVARGAADDKGQVFMHFKTVEAFRKTQSILPVNIKFLVEGEEEIASPSLGKFLEKKKDDLTADIILISDSSMWDAGMPAISYGLKGLAYLEIFVTGPNRDLHSGEFGGAVANPAEILARMIAQAKDKDGRILIPGFYDKVVEVTEAERKLLGRAPYDEEKYKKDLGVNELWGETGFNPLERTWIRPTFEVNGIWGGFTGVGAKTVIPSKAAAKLSMRLVPDQDPTEICELVEDFFKSIKPDSVDIAFQRHAGGYPVVVPLDNPFMEPARRALKESFGAEPLMLRTGGSIPIVADFKKILGLDSLLVGFCLPSARAHSPNENMHLPSLFTGMESLVRMLNYFGKTG